MIRNTNDSEKSFGNGLLDDSGTTISLEDEVLLGRVSVLHFICKFSFNPKILNILFHLN